MCIHYIRITYYLFLFFFLLFPYSFLTCVYLYGSIIRIYVISYRFSYSLSLPSPSVALSLSFPLILSHSLSFFPSHNSISLGNRAGAELRSKGEVCQHRVNGAWVLVSRVRVSCMFVCVCVQV